LGHCSDGPITETFDPGSTSYICGNKSSRK